MRFFRDKLAQEELVGFALIILIVGVIILVFVASGLNKSDEGPVESYEVEGFLQSALQYTTNCEEIFGNASLQDLIISCERGDFCGNENSCLLLNQTLNKILEENWAVGESYPNKGYEFEITSETKRLFYSKEGVETVDSKGGRQSFAKGREYVEVYFVVYS